ncbi:gamma-glutamylcyclotransferase [Acinetobacter qingfengensis]|uniref:Gamma-glutamylcyclotransferase AIG2-like domain-containing protein n=1 Tax=Acinetobacter qingfengensis TaxID=1262585 RepID=A0A1E7RG19_9GAMM|nr:gamma-glutamylcyclotransferase family protein [Acinetobacter qingfengensis]KAA8732782.1 gamma-glutamylcyclotransferase [Acinetobacter qingfengensis]OEY98105.1 hypothetical protein BJI46_00865 [Acinetobacter qingfengensis]
MNHLFTYGTLRPNHENAHILKHIEGTWQKGFVHGVVHILDWGPDQGLPAIVLDEQAERIEGYVLSSDKLVEHWEMLDEFEGFQYKRVRVDVELESGEITRAWIYVMQSDGRR